VIISTNPARAATYIVRLDRPVLCRRGGCGDPSAGEPLGLCQGHLANYQAARSSGMAQHYRQHAAPARVPTPQAARAFAILRAVTGTGAGPGKKPGNIAGRPSSPSSCTGARDTCS
jgi:hypothetical protein